MTDREICVALDKWEKTRKKFKTPCNDFERVRLHYEGVVIWPFNKFGFKKILSFFAFPIILMLYSRRDSDCYKGKVDAVISCSNKDFLLNIEDLPEELRKRYSSFERISKKTDIKSKILNWRLDKVGRKIVKRLVWAYPNKPLLYLSVLLHLAQVYMFIKEYNPKAIITTQTEQDFTASIVTYYCEQMGIKYICIQHGEYCYNPSMAYMRFSEYYAWNKETIDILELTNSPIDYAFIYTPRKLQKAYDKRDNREFFLKYYLSASDDLDEINKIRDVLLRFSRKGYKCAVRCHPRGYDTGELKRIFEKTDIHIEDSKDMTIGESISDCDYVVAFHSTVLSEAAANSMPIIIDDVTHDIDFLLRVHDINITRAECLLSDLIKDKL